MAMSRAPTSQRMGINPIFCRSCSSSLLFAAACGKTCGGSEASWPGSSRPSTGARRVNCSDRDRDLATRDLWRGSGEPSRREANVSCCSHAHCCCDVLVKFIPRQPRERIPLREACAEAFAMLIGAASEVAGNTGIKRTVGNDSRHNVDPARAHWAEGMSVPARRKDVDGRVERGHDVGTSEAPRSRRNSKPEVAGRCEAR